MTYGELASKHSVREHVLMTLGGTGFFGVMGSIVFCVGPLIMGFDVSVNWILRWCGIILVSMIVVAPSAMLLESNNRGTAANKMYASQRRNELLENTNVLLFVLHHELSGDELCTIDFGWSSRCLGDGVSRGDILIAAVRAGASLARAQAMIEAACKRHVLVTCYLRLENEPRETCPQVFLIGQHVLDRLAERVLVENVHVPDHIEPPRQYDFSDLL